MWVRDAGPALVVVLMCGAVCAAEPARFIATAARQQAVNVLSSNRRLDEAQRALVERAARLTKLRESDPEAFVVEDERYLKDLEVLAERFADAPRAADLRQTIGNEYLTLGDVQRFQRRDLRRAAVCYERAHEWLEGHMRARATFALAETRAYGLDDRDGAVAAYRRLLGEEGQAIAAALPDSAPWTRWLKRAVHHARTGRVFVGRIGREDLAIGSLNAIAAGLATSDVVRGLVARLKAPAALGDAAAVAAELRGLPPSPLLLLQTIPLLSLLRPDDAVSYVERNDPTRYWAALVMASAIDGTGHQRLGDDRGKPATFLPSTFDGAGPITIDVAAATFARRTGITLDVAPFADAAATWRYFTDGLAHADVRRALAACEPYGRQLFEPKLRAMPPDALIALGRRLRDAVGVAAESDRVKFGVTSVGREPEYVVFVRPYRGEWLVEQGTL